MEKLTIDELNEMLRFAFESGTKYGTYRDAPPSYFKRTGIKKPKNFEGWYKDNLWHELANQSKWISAEEDIKPAIDKDCFSVPVLILYKDGTCDVEKYDYFNSTFNCLADTQVTHWQPLPEPPKK